MVAEYLHIPNNKCIRKRHIKKNNQGLWPAKNTVLRCHNKVSEFLRECDLA